MIFWFIRRFTSTAGAGAGAGAGVGVGAGAGVGVGVGAGAGERWEDRTGATLLCSTSHCPAGDCVRLLSARVGVDGEPALRPENCSGRAASVVEAGEVEEGRMAVPSFFCRILAEFVVGLRASSVLTMPRSRMRYKQPI